MERIDALDAGRPGPDTAARAGSRLLVAFFIALPLLSGCTLKQPETDPALDRRAMTLATAIYEFNAGITASKGTGWLEMDAGHHRERYRMAWAAQAPNRLRLTLLLSGHPVETIAASGDWVTFVSHTGKHERHSAVSPDPDLEPYIGVPVRLSEMIALLLGRIPVRSFDRAWFSPDGNGHIYTGRQFSSERQEIRQDGRGRVSQFRILDRENRTIFGITFDDYTEKQGFTLARSLVLCDGHGRTLKISLPGIVPNAPVKESVFRLTGPGS